MTIGPPRPAPRERLELLEHECASLQGSIEGERAAITRLRADLDLLRQGRFPRGTWPLLGIVLGALVLAALGGTWVWNRAADTALNWVRSEAPVPLQLPHLLVTSEPQGAEVVVDGVPRGATPLLLATAGAPFEHRVVLTAAGHEQATVTVRLDWQAGRHVHLVLPSTGEQKK